jgi:hypothetical protein
MKTIIVQSAMSRATCTRCHAPLDLTDPYGSLDLCYSCEQNPPPAYPLERNNIPAGWFRTGREEVKG